MISVCIPTTRPDKLERCIDAVCLNAGILTTDYEIITEEDPDRLGCPTTLAKLVERSKYGLVCFLGDDCIPQKNFLKNALKEMEKLPDGWGVVGFNNQFNGETKTINAGHFLADKRMLTLLDGEFFHTGYQHGFCDNELAERASEAGRFVWAEDAVIENPHPMYDSETPSDEIYDYVYSEAISLKDNLLFLDRRKERCGEKIAIGMPISNRKNYNEFWLSFILMDKPESYTLLIPRFETYEYPSDIAAVRNDIVLQAMEHRCSKLIFLDTDQIYPKDAITKMIASPKKAIGGAVHKRYPPFDLVMYRGEVGKLERIPDEEVYSGDVINITATGCACICFDMELFAAVKKPWFEVTVGENGKVVGEDIGFSKKIRDAGYKIHVDTSIEVDHISTLRINRSTYELFKTNGRERVDIKENKNGT